MNLHYAGQIGGAFGWGVCGENLTRELAKHYTLTAAAAAYVVFMPLADHDLNPATGARGKINVGYTFFESELGPNAVANASRYDIVFAGSTWCLERMKERGITNGQLLIQGVDYSVFNPHPERAGSRLRIFSGGKFEWRKGQDLVIEAFKVFLHTHPNAVLVNSWYNPWPQLFRSMQQTRLLLDGVQGANQKEFFEALLIKNGLRPEQFEVLPQLGHEALASEMQNTDFGVFPNRCEGGTNLVLMEYLACGRRAAANLATGHADLTGADITEIQCGIDSSRWADQSVDEVLSAMLECAQRGNRQSPVWTWAAAAETVRLQINLLPAHRWQ